ncbi:hypothetical protein [Microbacterium karelineae]|uniref:hypothetical protein n=1 Tax=Microbacterium karelineae TaxID=2654283 RepID=UPI0012E9FFB9|nr:hypothetical protein [Microbacterium karelineae]
MTTMTLTSTAPEHTRTAPRPRSAVWRVGDTWTDPVSRTRWIIRTLNKATGAVELEAANTLHSSWWATTLDRLPKKGTAS